MDRTFDAAPLDSHCIPTKRRRFPDQSAVTVSYAAAMSGSDDVGARCGRPQADIAVMPMTRRGRIHMCARKRERNARRDWMDRPAPEIAQRVDNLVEGRAWTRC
jgi:hypothetical protein